MRKSEQEATEKETQNTHSHTQIFNNNQLCTSINFFLWTISVRHNNGKKAIVGRINR